MHKKNSILIISSMIHAYSHACMLSIAPLILLLQDEFSTSLTYITLVVTCSGLLFGFGALPFGALSDRIGALRVHLIGILIACVSCIGLYLSNGFLTFSFFLLCLGIASSTYHPSAFKLISTSFSSNIGRAFGINGMIGNVGQIGAPITSAFIAYNWGWRPVFLLLLVLGAVLGAATSLFRDYDVKGMQTGHIRSIKISKEFLLIMLITMTAGLAYRGTTTMLPTYTSIVYGKDTFQAGALVTLMLAMGGVSQVIAGEVNDRYGPRYPLVLMSVTCLFSIVVLLFAPYYAFIASLTLFGFAYFAVNLYTNVMIGGITDERNRGTYYGLTFLSRFGLGFLAPFIVGFVADAYSIRYLFHIVLAFTAVFLCLVAILMVFTPRFRAPKTSDTPLVQE